MGSWFPPTSAIDRVATSMGPEVGIHFTCDFGAVIFVEPCLASTPGAIPHTVFLGKSETIWRAGPKRPRVEPFQATVGSIHADHA